MAWVTYRGEHPEPSVTLPIPSDGVAVLPWPHRGASSVNEVVALPRGIRRRVSRWAGVWLAGARLRHGPWVEVRLEPGEWQACRQQAPWIVKATDATHLTHRQTVELFQTAAVRPYRVDARA